MTSFSLASGYELKALRDYLTRVVSLDPRAAVRLQGSGAVLGAWSGPPLDVWCLRPVALATEIGPVDATVSATRLLERLSVSAELDRLEPVEVPPSVAGPSWAGVLPPRTGWSRRAVLPAAAVHDAVRVGVDAFQRRLELVPAGARSQILLDSTAEQVWDRPFVVDVPLRAAHAADLLGLLGLEGAVSVMEAPGWWRLSCPGGSVALRSAPRQALDLFAL